VFDGDLSETKQEAMHKHQQRMIKQQQAMHSHIKHRIGNFFSRKLTSPKEDISPVKKESPRLNLSNLGSDDETKNRIEMNI
jgi:hypothetical protein